MRFCGWFKCYYDTLRFIFERITGDEAPCIVSLDTEFNTSFWGQADIEENKLKSVTQELQERRARVDWFADARSHLLMIDRARLLHRLPQLSSKKGGKRGRSRSQGRSRLV